MFHIETHYTICYTVTIIIQEILLLISCQIQFNCIEISESEQDEIEMEMLQQFFEYTESNAQKKWLHWNMKNNNFGFSAIEERYHNLGGDVRHIDENSLFNISQILKKKYGDHYAKDAVWNGKVMGKMYDIFQMNKIEDSKILNGEQDFKEYYIYRAVYIWKSKSL